MVIDDSQLELFKAHVLAEYPKEACGVLVRGQFIPCTNTADDPFKDFRISATDLVRIAMDVGTVEAILHSHPIDRKRPPKWNGSWPSHQDMVQWLLGTVPWGIVCTEGENISPFVWLDEGEIAPLEGRPFVHGVWDCYGAVRDWYRLEMKADIPNFPRVMSWWDRGLDHYTKNFEKAGFIEIPKADVRVGDACLMQVRSEVPNHAAVITGPNQILHHLIHRLSGFDRLDRWDRTITKFVRLVK